jgi:hypothetical protein
MRVVFAGVLHFRCVTLCTARRAAWCDESTTAVAQIRFRAQREAMSQRSTWRATYQKPLENLDKPLPTRHVDSASGALDHVVLSHSLWLSPVNAGEKHETRETHEISKESSRRKNTLRAK